MAVIPETLAGSGHDSVSESLRRSTVRALHEADTGADADFERLVRVAAQLFGAPVAAIALLDDDELWFYARQALEPERVPARGSPFTSVVTTPDITSLVVPDATADPRFAQAALVTRPPFARFYCGVPVVVHGQKVGALAVLSPEPDLLADEARIAALTDLSTLAGTLFELKDEARVRARMAADLVREEWRHALTLEAGKVGSWVWDLRTGDIVCNDIFRGMFGLEANKTLNVGAMMATIDPKGVEDVNAALRATFEEGVDYAVEFRVTATGRWLIGRGRVYQRDAAGRPLIMMGVNLDVTDAREAAEQTRALLRELNHRVKNTLAMIQSLARQTLRQKPDPQQFIDAFSGRLRTLSDAHGLLADRDWSGIGIIELLKSQVDPYLINTPDQLVLVGDDLSLPPDHALGLGLIIHELASNAVKYGALSRAEGRISVTWNAFGLPEPRLDLTWQEAGGPPVVPPRETGFGTRLIKRSLDKVLNSSVELSYPAEGAMARISMPLAPGRT